MNHRLVLTAALSAATMAMPSMAALPTGTLEFVQRTGTALANESIPIVMRLTLSNNSVPLSVRSDSIDGFDPADLPTQGSFYNQLTQQYETRPFAALTGASLNLYYSCQGNFTAVCDPSANYRFEFNFTGTPEHPSILGRSSFDLAPGASFQYTMGFFIPAAGGAAPGLYRWNGTGVTLSFFGVDADGNSGNSQDVLSFDSGNSLDPAVAFERQITAVPEPATYALMAFGVAALAGVARRRSTQG